MNRNGNINPSIPSISHLIIVFIYFTSPPPTYRGLGLVSLIIGLHLTFSI